MLRDTVLKRKETDFKERCLVAEGASHGVSGEEEGDLYGGRFLMGTQKVFIKKRKLQVLLNVH